MDTPLNKQGPRRKLKKIMKKSRVNLHASTQNLYQKKLKSAINVSLNSTRNVRSLQANNRSLASSLEKMRQDFRQVHDHYTNLLEKNHELRERILELERLVETSTALIEEEVNKRVEKRMQQVKRKLGALNTHTAGFLETLMELSEICCSRNTSTASASSQRNSSDIQKSLQTQRLSSPGFMRLRALDVPRPEAESLSESSMDTGQSAGSDEENNSQMGQPKTIHEMSLILEQSVMFPSSETAATTTCSLPLDSVSENDTVGTTSSEKQTAVSRLPLRVPKSSRDPKKYSTQQMSAAINKYNNAMNNEASKQLLRRETFTITSDQAVDSSLISDIAMPHLLGSCLSDESGEPTSDTETLTPDREYSSSTLSAVAQLTHILTDGVDVTSQLGDSSPVKTVPKSKVVANTKRNQSPTDKSHVSKPTYKGLKGKNKSGFNNSCKKQSLHIANEFKLLNAHQQLMNKMGESDGGADADYVAMLYGSRPDEKAGEHTIHSVDDMELTMASGFETSSAAPHQAHKLHTSADDPQDGESGGKASARSRTRSRSRPRQQPEDVDQASEENVPDAITMRFAKPGRFVFVASRKDSDGTRKNVPTVAPKARSKSKKQIAEMIENLPQTEPQSIFDFHDKTPTCLNSEKPKGQSVSPQEDGVQSPVVANPKHRSSSRAGRQKQESSPTPVTTQEISQSRATQTGQEQAKVSLLGEGITYTQALKGSPAEPKSKYRTRSQSRGRRRRKSGEQEATERRHSQGAAERTRSRGTIRTRGGREPSTPGKDSPQQRSRGRSKSRLSEKTQRHQTRSTSVKAADQTENINLESPAERDRKGLADQQIPAVTNTSSSPSGDRGRSSRTRKSLAPVKAANQTEKSASPVQRKRNPRAIADVTNVPLGNRSNRKTEEEKVEEGESQEKPTQLWSPPVPALRRKLKEMAEEKGGKTGIQQDGTEKVGQHEQDEDRESEEVPQPQMSISQQKLSYPLSAQLTISEAQDNTQASSSSDGQILSQVQSLTKEQDRPDSGRSPASSCHSPQSTQKSSLPPGSPAEGHSDHVRKWSRGKRSGRQNVQSSGSSSETQLSGDDRAREAQNSASLLSVSSSNSQGNRSRSKGKGDVAAKSSEGQPASSGEVHARSGGANREDMHLDHFEQESNQVLQSLKQLRSPAMDQDVDTTQSKATSPAVQNSKITPQKSKQGPKISRIVKGMRLVSPSPQSSRPGTPGTTSKRSVSPTAGDGLAVPDGKRRRAATKVNYAEMPLNTKLRRGDPFTSHYCSTEKVDIFKSPKSKARKKADLRRDILGPLHNLAIKEEVGGHSADTRQPSLGDV